MSNNTQVCTYNIKFLSSNAFKFFFCVLQQHSSVLTKSTDRFFFHKLIFSFENNFYDLN